MSNGKDMIVHLIVYDMIGYDSLSNYATKTD